MHSAELFNKGTEQLVKVKDEFENTYIFKVGKNDLPSYKDAMSKGTLVAFGFKPRDKRTPTQFRVPHTDEVLDEWSSFQPLKVQLVEEPTVVFIERIGKIMDGATDRNHLTAAIRGVEKLAAIQLSPVQGAQAAAPVEAANADATASGPAAAAAIEPTEILYHGKALVKVDHRWVARSSVPCHKCGEMINLHATAKVTNGVAEALAVRKSTDKNAHKVEGERYVWEHDHCPTEQHPDHDEHDATLGELDASKQKHVDVAPPLDVTVIDQMLTLLASDKTADFKLGYLTSYFEQEKRRTGAEYLRGFHSV